MHESTRKAAGTTQVGIRDDTNVDAFTRRYLEVAAVVDDGDAECI